ncbi:YidH family protein [Arundinibacter roseus]|uniref:DUF202 domain-containing protein n=1 Tax=Arundinibacter roseus TaxID=2070510 RepID=A0A4R4KJA8_9BACT|nr:DUF202 domain-containing protein [Arundinibacter roseus]TDB66926.1 DUF202 domain-containing protein [Arundinibacter roseus]
MENPLSLADWLAIERTKLANERTFLAYFRTSFALLAGGITIIRMDIFRDISLFGFVCLVLAPLVFFTGMWRYYSVKKRIDKGYFGRRVIQKDT